MQRRALAELAAGHGASLSELSRVLGRNAAYLQQYLMRGSPRMLTEFDRARLARYFGVPETQLGGPEPAAMVEVARIDIGASAGPGRSAEVETARGTGAFTPAQLRQMRVRPAAASMIRVEGDSMSPTLEDGDEILVDRDQRAIEGRGGIFVARIDGALVVKRLRTALGGIEVVSDNAAYPVRLVRGDAIEIVGRVAWLGRVI